MGPTTAITLPRGTSQLRLRKSHRPFRFKPRPLDRKMRLRPRHCVSCSFCANRFRLHSASTKKVQRLTDGLHDAASASTSTSLEVKTLSRNSAFPFSSKASRALRSVSLIGRGNVRTDRDNVRRARDLVRRLSLISPFARPSNACPYRARSN